MSHDLSFAGTILVGLGALYGGFDLEAGADGFMTGFAFPEVLKAMVDANNAGNAELRDAIYHKSVSHHTPIPCGSCLPHLDTTTFIMLFKYRRGCISPSPASNATTTTAEQQQQQQQQPHTPPQPHTETTCTSLVHITIEIFTVTPMPTNWLWHLSLSL